jgi:membrane protein
MEETQPGANSVGWFGLLRRAVARWSEHKDARSGAALAYYSVFSLGPLLVIVIAIAGAFFGEEAVRGEVAAALRGLLGDSGAQAIEAMLADAGRAREGTFATIFGIVALVFAAIGVVIQLKDALDTVWEVKPQSGRGLWSFARSYVLSLAGVMALGFLLLTSMVLTAVLAAVGKYIQGYLPEIGLQVGGFAVSFAMVSFLFAAIFKWLPDTTIAWRDVWVGAAATAALFELGKWVIGIYIAGQGLESTFGAAASIVIVLIWVYYSAQIVLLGAEFTAAYAQARGSRRPAR